MRVLILLSIVYVLAVNFIFAKDKKTQFNILWVRPYKAEQVYFVRQNLKIKIRTSNFLKKAEISGQTTVRDLYYSAKIKVIEIGDKKIPTKEKHEILEFYELKLGQKIQLGEKGTVLLVNKGEKGKEILMNEKLKPLPKNVLQDLYQIIELNTGGPTYNEMFGEAKNVFVGAEWDILKQNIITSYKAGNIIIDADKIKGKSVFEKIENNKMYFNGSFTIEPLNISIAKNRKLLTSKYNYQLFEIAPLDENKLPINVTKVTKHNYAEVDAENMEMEFTTEAEKELTVNYFETEKEMAE
jgi:hypothetical protein